MSRRPADDDAASGRRRLPPELVALAYARAERGEPSFPTEESLAGQDEATSELRQALDDVRKLLDVESAPPPPRRRHRRLPAVLLAVLVVALLAVLVAVVLPRGGDGGPAAAADVAAETSPATGSLPNTGPGVDTAGTAVGVRAAGDALEVVEQTVLAAPETAALTLRLPDLTGLGGRVAGLTPRVERLQVSFDGVPVEAAPAADGGWTATPPEGGAVRVVATYRLTGAVLPGRATSKPGRAIAVLPPILGGPVAGRETGALPLVVRALRPWVIGVSCPGAEPGAQACGTEDAAGWTARVPGAGSPVVLLQVQAG